MRPTPNRNISAAFVVHLFCMHTHWYILLGSAHKVSHAALLMLAAFYSQRRESRASKIYRLIPSSPFHTNKWHILHSDLFHRHWIAKYFHRMEFCDRNFTNLTILLGARVWEFLALSPADNFILHYPGSRNWMRNLVACVIYFVYSICIVIFWNMNILKKKTLSNLCKNLLIFIKPHSKPVQNVTFYRVKAARRKIHSPWPESQPQREKPAEASSFYTRRSKNNNYSASPF